MKLLCVENVQARRAGVLGALILLTGSLRLAAQMPGAPVLQNVWTTPGLAVAADVAGGTGSTAYAGALSWAPRSARFQLSGGGGAQTQTGNGSRGVYGARVAIPFGGGPSSDFGFAAFAGIGGRSKAKSDKQTSIDSTASTTQAPLGVALGWRHALGATHGISLYADPTYVLFSGGSKSDGLFRTSIGADAGITRSLGATIGVEFGGTRTRELGGPTGTLYAFGLSYAFGHH